MSSDAVNSPKHYVSGKNIECIDAIAAAVENLNGTEAHLTACCMKYLWRWKGKNGSEDLKKCQRYLGWLIEYAERTEHGSSTRTDY